MFNFVLGVLIILFCLFKLGDYVEVGGKVGIVKKIEIFFIELCIFDNKVIIMFNLLIMGSLIINFFWELICCIDLVIGVGYDVDLKEVKVVFKLVLDKEECLLKDLVYIVVVFEFVDLSVNFVVCLWVNLVDYWLMYFDLMENIKIVLDDVNIIILFL